MLTKMSKLNLERLSHKFHLKKIYDKLADIDTWLGNHDDSPAAIAFINKYFANLNNLTKNSLFEKVKVISNTSLVEIGYLNQLSVLFDELVDLIDQIDSM